MAPECPCESMSILSSRLHLSVDLLGTVASGNQTRHDTGVSFVVHLHDCEADTSASFVSGECTNLSLVISLYLCLSRSVCLPVCLCLFSPLFYPPPPPQSFSFSRSPTRVCLSLSLSCLCLSVCLSVCLYVCLSVCLPLSLSLRHPKAFPHCLCTQPMLQIQPEICGYLSK